VGGEILGVNMTGPDIVAQILITTGFVFLVYIIWNEWIRSELKYFIRSLYHREPKVKEEYGWWDV